ncbi:pilus assembly protein TadG-related protein [Sphingobium sp. AN558]|uniref:pilus assembly protein TadG-related protein n=1 Tax=Sphingobium sp. AN558 TaxID=3133442 RepID=UPI0030BAECAF
MTRRSSWARLAKDRRGGITILLAGSLFMLAGAATVAVDLGSVFLAKRQLQGVADAAALAASAGGRTAVEALLERSGLAGVQLKSLESGYYSADGTIAVAERFLTGDARSTATRLELTRSTPLFFGRLLVGRSALDIRARAMAARADAAAFSIGTGLASVSDGLPNQLLSALAGTELNLTVMDSQGLANLNVDLLHFADALRVRLGRDGEAYGDLFNRNIPVGDILEAMATSSGAGPASVPLRAIAGRIPGRSVRLSELVDLGPMARATNGSGQPNILLDAFTMLRLVLSPPSGTSVPMDLRVAVPGLTSTRLMLITGPGQARSPMLSITSDHDVVVRTGVTRLYLETSVATALGGIASVRIPLYAELAASEARLSDINCTDGARGKGVTLAVTPSIGSVALADIDTAALTDFSSAATPGPAVLVQLLGTRITGYANVTLGGTQAQAVYFSAADIAAKQPKTVSTQDLTQGLAASVASRAQMQVSLLGLTVSTSPLAPAIGAILGTTAPLIDNLLNSVTSVLGVKLGTAQVRVHEMRCGVATLVG